MMRSTDQSPEDTRRLWPLVRLFGILTDIAAQEVATRQDVETAAPLEVGADLLAGEISVLMDSGEDRSEQEAA